jgi:peptidyl-prolyl cis-trans isomerase A (cyclophilin A)
MSLDGEVDLEKPSAPMKSRLALSTRSWFVGTCFLLALGCGRKAAPEPAPKAKDVASASDEVAAKATASATQAPAPVKKSKVPVTPGDPEAGDFTIEEALADLPGSGAVSAEIDTDQGKLTCELFADRAPITVANFVGLARGTRPWLDKGAWVKKPLYNGTVFHRVIKGFMIQGGDPNKNGSGGPGYVIQDEVWPGASHDTRGQICMANRGPDTNGSQFFIMDGKAKHLDSGYTIFGQCGPDAVLDKLASVEVRGDQSVIPSVIKSVTISRKADGAKK